MSYIKFSPNGDVNHFNNLGQPHRTDGPAQVHYYFRDSQKVVAKSWWINNRLHRLDGPALIQTNGDQHWYYHGTRINCSSQEEFERLLKLKAFW